MKSFKKLNARGFSHHFVMAFIVMAAAIGGTYYLVASHAQVPYKNPYTCASQTLLQTGSKGTCVSYLQYSIGVTADGDFGPATKLAVQNFQFANHIAGSSCTTRASTCDGIVGSYTWAKVNAINSTKTAASLPKPVVAAPVTTTPKPAVVAPKPAVVAPKPAVAAVPVKPATVTTAPATTDLCPGTPASKPVLKVGSTGNCVRYLQQRLKISQDGVFGGGTHGAVVAFQATNKLNPDGVVGACTWTFLDNGTRSAACTKNTSTTTSSTSNSSSSTSKPAGSSTQAAKSSTATIAANQKVCYKDYKNVTHTGYVSQAACDSAKAADQASRNKIVNCLYGSNYTTVRSSRQSCYNNKGEEMAAPLVKHQNVVKATATKVYHWVYTAPSVVWSWSK